MKELAVIYIALLAGTAIMWYGFIAVLEVFAAWTG